MQDVVQVTKAKRALTTGDFADANDAAAKFALKMKEK